MTSTRVKPRQAAERISTVSGSSPSPVGITVGALGVGAPPAAREIVSFTHHPRWLRVPHPLRVTARDNENQARAVQGRH